jgi:hypothetical protein
MRLLPAPELPTSSHRRGVREGQGEQARLGLHFCHGGHLVDNPPIRVGVSVGDYFRQRYGVVVDTRTRPERSRIGREYSVESLWMRVLPARNADLARTAVSAR